MKFTWQTRLKYAVLAYLAGWFAGWLVTIPFVVAMAWRYVDAHVRLLPSTLAEGLVIWGAFSLTMSMAGFALLALPLLLCVPPRWIVRWRGFLTPLVTMVAILVLYYRLGLVSGYYFLHPQILYDMFISGPNVFLIAFAPVMMWVYTVLAKRRLSAAAIVADPRRADPR
jgi:hypothetical protein